MRSRKEMCDNCFQFKDPKEISYGICHHCRDDEGEEGPRGRSIGVLIIGMFVIALSGVLYLLT